MMRYTRLEHRFVEFMPSPLEPGVLYISMTYATAAHQCCCGCGEEIVTPFTPTDWRMTFDGETISLRPSIGNWNLACRSHYVIDRSEVIESAPWSEAQVAAGRAREKAAKARFYGRDTIEAPPTPPSHPREEPEAGFWRRLFSKLGW